MSEVRNELERTVRQGHQIVRRNDEGKIKRPRGRKWDLPDGKVLLSGIVFHARWYGHFDELFDWFLIKFYHDNFQSREVRNGFTLARDFQDYEVQSDDEADGLVQSMRRKGKYVIAVGIGSGALNEHKSAGRLKNTCSADLLAARLRVGKTAWGSQILKQVRRADNEANQQMFELGREVKDMVRLSYTKQQILDMAFLRFGVVMRRANAMYACGQEFNRDEDWGIVGGVKIAFIDSDSPFGFSFARQMGADIVIKRNGAGSVQIQMSHGIESRLWFTEIAKEICEWETSILGGLSDDESQAYVELTGEAAANGVDRDMPGADGIWYLHKQSLLNGTETHERPPTQLTRSQLIEAVVTALGRVPPRGDAAKNLKEIEMRLRKLTDCLRPGEEGAAAALIANRPEFERQLRLLGAASHRLYLEVGNDDAPRLPDDTNLVIDVESTSEGTSPAEDEEEEVAEVDPAADLEAELEQELAQPAAEDEEEDDGDEPTAP